MPVVRTNGLSGGRAVYGHVITRFSRLGRLLHFLTHAAALARFARESSAIILSTCIHYYLIRYSDVGAHELQQTRQALHEKERELERLKER